MGGAFDTCCAYFCTGLSVFGVLGLVRCVRLPHGSADTFLMTADGRLADHDGDCAEVGRELVPERRGREG